MSIRIGHGYRIHHANIEAFLDLALTTLGPVRDHLDAALYAQTAATVHDAALRGVHAYTHDTLREEALAEYMEQVGDGSPVYVWHHPHSLDFDYGRPASNTDPNGPWYLLLHAQRDEYHDALRALPGVEAYEYYNHTDTYPDGVSEQDWQQRRADWQWLIDAHRIKDVTTRRTHRDDPAPDLAYVTRPEVFIRHLPTPAQRAETIARDITVAEALAQVTDPQWPDVNDALWSDTRRAHAARITPAITDQLPPITPTTLSEGQPAPLALNTEPLPADWREQDAARDATDDD